MDDRTLAKLGLSRRTMLKSGVGAAAFTGMSKFGLRGSLAQDAEWPRFDGETVRVFTFAGNPFIEGPVKLHGPEFRSADRLQHRGYYRAVCRSLHQSTASGLNWEW